MRRTRVIAVLFATTGLAACGSSSHPVGATASHLPTAKGARPGVPTATSPGASRPPSTRQALAFARAVNLTAADLPGFKVPAKEKERESPAEKRIGRELPRCIGGRAAGKGLAEVSSREFERGAGLLHQSAQSEVNVAPSSSVAAEELAALRSAHARACLSRFLDLLLKTKKFGGATVGRVSISQGVPPAPGATGSFAWRVAATVIVQRLRIRLYIDILGFVYGPAEVALFAAGVPIPFPARAEERLFRLLLERAKAHKF